VAAAVSVLEPPATAPEFAAGPASNSAEARQTVAPAIFASESSSEEAPVKSPESLPASSGAPGIDALRHAIGTALVDAGHVSAAQLLGSGSWNIDGANLRIEVPGMGKKMLALTINQAAEKVIRQELQRLGASTRFMVVPGEGAAAALRSVEAAPVAGSIQETALNDTLVQRAREIFNAEVRSVIDLRQK
jgi:DNA polymerase-3 subunit gamma/tau